MLFRMVPKHINGREQSTLLEVNKVHTGSEQSTLRFVTVLFRMVPKPQNTSECFEANKTAYECFQVTLSSRKKQVFSLEIASFFWLFLLT